MALEAVTGFVAVAGQVEGDGMSKLNITSLKRRVARYQQALKEIAAWPARVQQHEFLPWIERGRC